MKDRKMYTGNENITEVENPPPKKNPNKPKNTKKQKQNKTKEFNAFCGKVNNKKKNEKLS